MNWAAATNSCAAEKNTTEMFHEKNFPLSSKKCLSFHLNIELNHKTGLKTLGSTKINRGGDESSWIYKKSTWNHICHLFPLKIMQVAWTIFNLQASHIIRFEKPNRDYALADCMGVLLRVHVYLSANIWSHIFTQKVWTEHVGYFWLVSLNCQFLM